MTINSEPLHPDLTGYALGLLDAEERRAVERHALACAVCRSEIQTDRQLDQLVRSTLQTVTHIDNGRLRKLMPTSPRRRVQRWQVVVQRQLVPVCMLLLLFFSGLGVYQTMQHEPTNGVGFPTALAATATHTVSPTETAVATRAVETAVETAAAANATQLITPSPAATPIAYLNHGE